MIAYARLLVARYPDKCAARLAMSDAYAQVYKNAWRDNDRAAIESQLEASVG